MILTYITNVRMPTEKAHGIQMTSMCEAFGKLGVKVDFFVPKRKNPIKEDPFVYYGLEKKFVIKKLSSSGSISSIGYVGFWVQALTFTISVISKFLFTSRKKRLMYTREVYLAFILRILGYKTVYESHGVAMKKKLFFFLARKTKLIVTNSEGVAKAFRDRGFRCVYSLRNGVDIDRFICNISTEESRLALGLPLNKHIIVYTGGLYGWKGLNTVVEAVKVLENKGQYLFVVVGGSIKEVEDYRRKSEGLPIEFVGLKARIEVPKYLCSAEILLLPNSAKTEESVLYTSPMKVPEYMASKRPIIASNLPSIRELLNDESAVFVEPDNPKELAMEVQTLSKDSGKREKMANVAYLEVGKYTWEERAKKILGYIDNVYGIKLN